MFEILTIVSILFNLIILIFVFMIFQKNNKGQKGTEFLSIEKAQEKLERSFREDMGQIRQEIGGAGKQNREELTQILHTVNQSIMATIGQMANQQKNVLDSFTKQLTELTAMNEQKLERLRTTVEQKLSSLQDDNNKKLEQMRQTVDEKLHATLEQRLGESFKQVSDRLELVHKGLGEMQNLASGVGDLKRVLTNVKARGTLGEIQLGSLLEQILSFDQYEANVATKKGSSERVEFAVKLPSKEEKGGSIYIPIDSKFPLEDYQRLLEAQDTGDIQGANEAAKQLEIRIKAEAKSIRDKYINPPATTDFAIMFLPLEGLYAEVLRRPGLWDTLQREYRVIITGPTTLAALLNSLQMGFRTLAIQKRSSEVWGLLGAVKTEFGKFGDILDKTQKKLQEASNTIENAARRGRAIERKLKTVEELPSGEATALLGELEMASSSTE
jgi:DNA recombination protein RmuC